LISTQAARFTVVAFEVLRPRRRCGRCKCKNFKLAVMGLEVLECVMRAEVNRSEVNVSNGSVVIFEIGGVIRKELFVVSC
jgi:hypothetical protein